MSLWLAGCSGPSEQAGEPAPRQPVDPLRNTRRLVTEGHRSLYDNGAFQVPYTELKLIPPGPEVEEVLLAGRNANAAFWAAVDSAKQSVDVVADGTQYSYALATEIHEDTADIIAAIHAHSRPGSKLIAYRGYLAGKGIRGVSWEAAESAQGGLARVGQRTKALTADVGQSAIELGEGWIAASPELAMAIVAAGSRTGERLEGALDENSERMAEAIERQGHSLRIAGAARLLTSPGTVGEAHSIATDNAARVDADTRAAGQRLAASGRATGDALVETGRTMANRAVEVGRQPYDAAANLADRLEERTRAAVPPIRESLRESGQTLSAEGTQAGLTRQRQAEAEANQALRQGESAAAAELEQGANAFLLGYAALPARLAQRADEVQVSASLEALGRQVDVHGDWASERTDHFLGVIRETSGGYGEAVQLKLERASKEFDEGKTEFGVSLPLLKALRWVVEALVWDGAVRPVGEATGAALGYLAVGGVAYPALVTYEAGKATANVAVQVTRGVALGAYDIVAPTGEAALAGLLAAAHWTRGVGTRVAVGVGGAFAGAGHMAGSQLAGASMDGAGATLQAATEYVAVPLAQAGLHAGGGVAGVVAGTTAVAAGTGLMATGQVLKAGAVGTGAALEHIGAPLAAAAAQAAGTGGGVLQGAYDEASGVVIYATGGVLTGMARAAEWSMKYGVSPAADLASRGAGAVGGGVVAAAKATGGGVVYLWGQVVKGGGMLGGQFVEHAAAPVTMAGIAGVGVTAGYATEAAGTVGGAVTAMAGEAAAATTWLFGNTVAAATFTGGTAVSTAYGAGVGLYEVASAAVVPVGHVGGAAIVLTYKSIAHLGAHSVLAVSDAAYLVLSLEGPRWVIYAVQGKLGDGSDLPEGAIVDLEAMDSQGERFYNVPVSDAEMEKVLRSVQEELPRMPAAEPK